MCTFSYRPLERTYGIEYIPSTHFKGVKVASQKTTISLIVLHRSYYDQLYFDLCPNYQVSFGITAVNIITKFNIFPYLTVWILSYLP